MQTQNPSARISESSRPHHRKVSRVATTGLTLNAFSMEEKLAILGKGIHESSSLMKEASKYIYELEEQRDQLQESLREKQKELLKVKKALGDLKKEHGEEIRKLQRLEKAVKEKDQFIENQDKTIREKDQFIETQDKIFRERIHVILKIFEFLGYDNTAVESAELDMRDQLAKDQGILVDDLNLMSVFV